MIVRLLCISWSVIHLLLLKKLLVLHLSYLLGFLLVHNHLLLLLLLHLLDVSDIWLLMLLLLLLLLLHLLSIYGILLSVHLIGLRLEIDHLWAGLITIDLLVTSVFKGRAMV